MVLGVPGFSSKPMIRNSSSTCRTPNLPGKVLLHLDDRHGKIGVFFQVIGDHLPVVHLVDVVSRKDEDQVGAVLLQDIDVLVDGVGGSQVPVFSDSLLGRNEVDEFIQLGVEDVPTLEDMAVEGKGFVLGEQVDPADSGIQAVAQGEVDDAVDAAEGNGRLGPILGKGIESFSPSARQDHRQDSIDHREGS